MTVEFVGMIGTRDVSETRAPSGPPIDLEYVRRFSRVHEEAGFDRVLIGYGSSTPDGTQVAAYAAAHTSQLGLLIAHRPGFVAPTTAARTFATLDQLSGGRVAVHTITGGSDAEQRRDGDYLGKDDRYARTEEYLSVLRRAWTSPEPFSHDGRFYKFEDFSLLAQPAHRIPLYFGGSSEAAYRAGGAVADVYALWGEPLKETAEQIAKVQASAAAAGRDPLGISVSFRPILAATDALAWERAERILATIEESKGGKGSFTGDKTRVLGGPSPENVGSQRLLAAAARSDRHDRALWTATAKASGAQGNSTALVGSPETVAQALLDYVDIGVTTILIRGYDPVDDAVDYGRHLLPLVKQELSHRSLVAA
ncbi:LLM class flavin-dependent oxidoreductase [Actinoplanes friuliensis]|uniref:Alkanesulfonate monooxygenase n=1 Tax=Actinoplanes friuliensis DSM 7358 TaxID=1246995 RepID=U5W734_9ACTN|nr:LLM class flavin-dependent oxidoreductase [Actinoplanes friuliensis]AGZ44812.1 alkanesulfonate monooxygenase [Actinoplanes friuliensis DSM 7358]